MTVLQGPHASYTTAASRITPFDLEGARLSEALHPVEGQTDIGDAQKAAWSYRAPFEAMARIGDLVSFEPDKVEITIDGQKLEPVPGQRFSRTVQTAISAWTRSGASSLWRIESPARVRG